MRNSQDDVPNFLIKETVLPNVLLISLFFNSLLGKKKSFQDSIERIFFQKTFKETKKNLQSDPKNFS